MNVDKDETKQREGKSNRRKSVKEKGMEEEKNRKVTLEEQDVREGRKEEEKVITEEKET